MQSKNFESTFESIHAFMLKIEDLVREIVTQNNLSYYRIESNMKHVDAGASEKSYVPVIRIVTYFEDTTTQISEILNSEFDISVDKHFDKKKNGMDHFSYKHLNFMAALKPNRLELTEYKRSGDKRFEIQICSMLQDALSGIEKEFGYDTAIPEDAKRDFYRVTTLLEMADIELLKIKNRLNPQGKKNEVTTAPLPVSAELNIPAPEEPAKSAPQSVVAEPVQPDRTDEINIPGGGVSSASPAAEEKAKEEQQADPEKTETTAKEAPKELPQMPDINTASAEGLKRRPILSNMDKVVIVNVNANGMIEKPAEKAPEPTQPAPAEKEVPFFEDKVALQEQQAAHPVLDENDQITETSLREYALKSGLLKEVDTQIAERAGARINNEVDIEGDVERLRFLKVNTLKQLHEKITDNKDEIVAFAEKWIGKDNGGSFDSGIGLFYLEYLLVGKKNDPAFAVEYVVKFISDNDYSARYIIPTYNSIRNAETAGYSHLTLKS